MGGRIVKEMPSAAHDPALDITQLKDTVLRQQRQIEELGAQLARSSAEKTDLLRRARVVQCTSLAPSDLPPALRPHPGPEPDAAVRLSVMCARWAGCGGGQSAARALHEGAAAPGDAADGLHERAGQPAAGRPCKEPHTGAAARRTDARNRQGGGEAPAVAVRLSRQPGGSGE